MFIVSYSCLLVRLLVYINCCSSHSSICNPHIIYFYAAVKSLVSPHACCRALGNKSNTVPPADGNRKQQQQQQHHGQRQDQRLDWEQQQDQQSACLLAGTATGQKRSAEQVR